MLKNNVFTENFIYEKYSLGTVKFIKKRLLKKKRKINELVVLDYGCGPCTIYKYIKFKKIYLYDIFPINKKKLSKNFKIIKSENKIKKISRSIDLVLVNSVIQYMSIAQINKLISTILPIMKKGGIIFFGDIPQYNRFIEIVLLLMNPIILIYILKYFLNRLDYLNFKYYLHKQNSFKNNVLKKFKNKTSFSFDKSSSIIFKFRYSCFVKKN